MSKVLVDTSAWIEFFRTSSTQVGDRVQELIEQNRATCSGIILTELLSGTRSQREFTEVLDMMMGLEIFYDTPEICVEAGRIAFSLRRQGMTIPLADTLIAAQATVHHLAILSLDQHFREINGILDLKLVKI